MKTVKGTIRSSTPISVSKAAKIIANFVDTDNGASQAISAYLRRASASFNELKSFHRELRKVSKSDGKHKRSKSETTVEGAGDSSLEPSVFNSTHGGVEPSSDVQEHNSKGKKQKTKKKKENSEVGISGKDSSSKPQNKNKKRKKSEVDN